jgi:uncharacterized protein DUF3891
MILRPLETVAPSTNDFASAWEVVQRTQSQKYKECWLITQPSHAVLAGELAAKVSSPQLPKLDDNLLRAIAMHDAGWGVPDAQAINRSRSAQGHRPESFIEVPAAQFLEAWEESIAAAQSVAPAGGYIVSRHFCRIAESRAQSGNDIKQVQHFLDRESQRQKKLLSKQSCETKELELLTDLLQFCDLLSLYICCGAQEKVVFPEYFGGSARLTPKETGLKLDPPLIVAGSQFSVAALRHPATKEVSNQQIAVKIV